MYEKDNFKGSFDWALTDDGVQLYGGKIYYKDIFIKLVPFIYKTKGAANKRIEELVNTSKVIRETDNEVWITYDDGRTYQYNI
jgi:hypothetical protein